MSSLYIHVPFCRRKCPYCDFYSLPENATALTEYPGLLITQLHLLGERRPLPQLKTVFFGGGTPSLLSPEAVAEILNAIASRCGIADDAEISLEANPGTVTPDRLAGYRCAGINRLSLGVQSLQTDALHLLGRIHSPQEARQALDWARNAGFASISADLMFALPGQDLSVLLQDASELADRCDHLSCYGLSIEEETPFHHKHRRGELLLPDEDAYAGQFLALDELLSTLGFEHYEISNYARPGHACQHNLTYWRRKDYLGLGAGAHSFCDSNWGERYATAGNLKRFRSLLRQRQAPEEHLESFDLRGAMAETLYLGLRMAEGVSESAFHGRFSRGVAEAFPEALSHCGEHLQLHKGRWRFDVSGWLLFDHLIPPFLG